MGLCLNCFRKKCWNPSQFNVVSEKTLFIVPTFSLQCLSLQYLYFVKFFSKLQLGLVFMDLLPREKGFIASTGGAKKTIGVLASAEKNKD